MKKLYLIGAGGFSNEVLQLVEMLQEQQHTWSEILFIDDNPDLHQSKIRQVEVVGGIETIIGIGEQIDVVVTINKPLIRQKIVKMLTANENIFFPNLISPFSLIDYKYSKIGNGNIVMHYCILSTNLVIGNSNIFNSYSVLGHDCCIEHFNSFGPKVAISGKVSMGSMNDFGVSAIVLQNKSIGNGNEIWINSSIMKNIKDNGVYFGVPAKKIFL